MSEQTIIQKSANIIPLHAEKAAKASELKWGKDVISLGFCIIPSLLLKAQRRLNLNATQLAILMHLADYWWDAQRKPYPAKKTLAESLSLSPRQVQRYIAEFEKAGLVKRVYRTMPNKGKTTNEYDLSGLVKRLQELAPQFQEVENQIKSLRNKIKKPSLRKTKTQQLEKA